MTLQQIEYFLSIVEHKTFSRASEINYITQPTLSKHIKNLETELGAVLFDRSKTPIELTPIGKIYMNIFKRFISDLHEAQSLSNGAKKGLSLKIGLLSAWKLPVDIKKRIHLFQSEYPEIPLEFANHNAKDLIAKLNNNALDMAFILLDFIKQEKNLSAHVLCNVKKHVLYNEEILGPDAKFRDFRNETFFCLSQGGNDPCERLIVEYCQNYELLPIIKCLPNIDSIISNIEFGNGVTIVDALTQYSSSAKIKGIEIKPDHILCLAWNTKNNNPANELFINLFTDNNEGDADKIRARS